MKICILATGPSMSQAVADSVRGNYVIAISNAGIEFVDAQGVSRAALAPWAHELCAQDHAWWREHPQAHQFAGRKFSANKIVGVEQVVSDYVQRQSSSGVLGLQRAWLAGDELGLRDVELHGYDNRGTHYFGVHRSPLNNTHSTRFNFFAEQLKKLGGEMKKAGFRIINRTPNSALTCFETA
jgi:hypothetical protein